MIDLKRLWGKLSDLGLERTPFAEMNKDEIEATVEAVISSFADDAIYGWSAPYISELSGDLVIPANSHPKYHYWKPEGQSIRETLLELNASMETFEKYGAHPDIPF